MDEHMCPQCGDVFPPSELIPAHDDSATGSLCRGVGQVPRNALTDGRALWSGRANMRYYRNLPDWPGER